MEKGITLEDYPFEKLPRDAISQLEQMYYCLQENNLAHCDIKGGNIVIIEEGKRKKLKLIDADCLSEFGEPRKVCSPGHNISRQDYQTFRKSKISPICNEMTDFEGFQKLKQYVSLKGEELERIKALQKFNFVVKDLSAIEEVGEDSEYEGEDVLFGKREPASLYITFIMATMNKGIDILILLDCTGSMSAQIEMSKNTILQTIDFVKKRYPKSTSRFGFIGYRDFEDGPQRIVKMDFTNDFNALKDFISRQAASGGGDEAEDLVGALEVA